MTDERLSNGILMVFLVVCDCRPFGLSGVVFCLCRVWILCELRKQFFLTSDDSNDMMMKTMTITTTTT